MLSAALLQIATKSPTAVNLEQFSRLNTRLSIVEAGTVIETDEWQQTAENLFRIGLLLVPDANSITTTEGAAAAMSALGSRVIGTSGPVGTWLRQEVRKDIEA